MLAFGGVNKTKLEMLLGLMLVWWVMTSWD